MGVMKRWAARAAMVVLLVLRGALVRLRAVVIWAAAVDVRDVFLLSGIALLGFGLWQIWKPLPYVVIGALLIRLAVGFAPPTPPDQEMRRRHGAR